jgi:hypothetical protein
MQKLVSEAADPRSFHYLVKSDESKVLALIRIPKLHKIKRDQRDQLFTMVEKIL